LILHYKEDVLILPYKEDVLILHIMSQAYEILLFLDFSFHQTER